jgi:hypothetical protein
MEVILVRAGTLSRKAKVRQLKVVKVIYQEVFWLQITMTDAASMEIAHGVNELLEVETSGLLG